MCQEAAPALAGGCARRRLRYEMKRELNQNLADNEVSYTVSSLLVIFKIRVVFIAGKVLI